MCATPANSADTEAIHVGGLPLNPGDRVGPYVFESRIGAGGMAWVLLARDPDGHPVALKVLKASRLTTGQVRFRREFRSLARINHPNVIRVESYGDIYGHPYIAMEYVQGQDLHSLIRSLRAVPVDERWQRVEKLLVELCRGLAHIHRRGLVHRDLKPSNILIDPQGRAKITDFGIVKDLDPSADPNVSNTLVGTWAYASPEQICGDPLDHRSDLYSLGVILFAMLTGRRPFVAKDMAGYLELHRDYPAPRARDVVPEVPAHLDEICIRLLRKSPRDRFQSAQEILFRLERADAEKARPMDTTQWELPLVGREQETAALKDAVAGLTRGRGGAVLLLGPLGCGRTRLLDHAVELGRALGFPIHRSRTREQDAAFGALRRFASELVRDLGPDVPPDLPAVLDAFTIGQDRLRGDIRYRLHDAIRQAMERALETGPRILALDNLHYAREPFLDLLDYLLRTMVATGYPLLVVGTARTDSPNAVVDHLRDPAALGIQPVYLDLTPLPARAILDLVRTFLGDAQGTEALAERLERETEGNPLFLSLFLQTLLHRGVIVQGPGGLALALDNEEIRAGHLEIPPGIRNLLGERLALVPPAQRRVLEVIAVNGRETDLDILLDVMEEDEERTLDQVDVLVRTRILAEHRAGSVVHVDFSHGKYGDIIYRDLPPDRRVALHRRLAAVYELRSGGSAAAAEVIGEHYRRAGESGKAYRHLTVAASRLHERSVSKEAWELADRAVATEELARLDLDPLIFQSTRLTLQVVRADILYGKGEWERAQELQKEALELASNLNHEEQVCRVSLAQALTEARLGRDEDATRLMTDALTRARALENRELVADALHGLSAAAWNRGDLDTCGRMAAEGLVIAVGPEMEGVRANLLMAQTAVQASLGHIASATAGLTEAEGIFRSLGLKRARCLALANLSECQAWHANLAAALECGREARALGDEILFRIGEGFGARAEGVAALELGQAEASRKHLGKALEILAPLKVSSEIVATRYALGCWEILHGTSRAAQHHLSVARGLASQRDTEGYLPLIQATLAHVFHMSGDAFQAEQMLERVLASGLVPRSGRASRPGAVQRPVPAPLPRQIQSLTVAAQAYARLGKPGDALEIGRRALDLARARGLRLWMLDALLVLGACCSNKDEAARYQQEASALAREILDALPGPLADSFRGRAGPGRVLP